MTAPRDRNAIVTVCDKCLPAPCVCGHDPDEHHDVHGCLADRFGASGYPCQCLCATYEPNEADR